MKHAFRLSYRVRTVQYAARCKNKVRAWAKRWLSKAQRRADDELVDEAETYWIYDDPTGEPIDLDGGQRLPREWP